MDLDLRQDIEGFFAGRPHQRTLFDQVAQIIHGFCQPVVKVSKTQITFGCPKGFAFVSLPIRRLKGWPEQCIILSFGLEQEVKHPRMMAVANPYPNRWTHHVVVAEPGDLDQQVVKWLEEAYWFAFTKKPRNHR